MEGKEGGEGGEEERRGRKRGEGGREGGEGGEEKEGGQGGKEGREGRKRGEGGKEGGQGGESSLVLWSKGVSSCTFFRGSLCRRRLLRMSMIKRYWVWRDTGVVSLSSSFLGGW